MSHKIRGNKIIFDAINPHYEDYKNGEPACTIRGFADDELKLLKNSSLESIEIFLKEDAFVCFSREITNIKIADMYKLDDGRTPVVISWEHPSEHTETLQKAITHYGEPVQVLKAIEELAELIEAINEYCECHWEGFYTRRIANASELIKTFAALGIQENNHYQEYRTPISKKAIATEIADVRIMLQQLEMFLVKPEEVQEQIDFKVKRLEERMKEKNAECRKIIKDRMEREE